MSYGRILFIDAYDSFSNNITNLLETELGVRVDKIRINDPRFVLNDDAFHLFLKDYDAVLAGPGPGNPQNPEDVGLIAKIWSLPEHAILPALGICLGFQSLCLANGAAVERLKHPRHGIVTEISHSATSIFSGVQDVRATQYHSLCVRLWDKRLGVSYQSFIDCELVPTAWDMSDVDNGSILMAVEHAYKPFAGVQFHPESVSTNAAGKTIIANWWYRVCQWWSLHPKHLRTDIEDEWEPQQGDMPLPSKSCHQESSVAHVMLDLPEGYAVNSIVDRLRLTAKLEPIVLQSGTRENRPLNEETGRYSIVALQDPSSLHIRYSCATSLLQMIVGKAVVSQRHASISEAFVCIETFMSDRRAETGPAETPFWGGLVGYVTYEAGLSSINVQPDVTSNRSDIWFVFVERSIVVDHCTGTAYVQSIRADDGLWLWRTAKALKTALICESSISKANGAEIRSEPQNSQYLSQVKNCQAYLRAGESYELCLTDQTTVQTEECPWQMYKRLSVENPAPFGAYMRFGNQEDPAVGVAIVGSSPERFVSWSRDGLCQFRPIKGTVSKASGVSRAEAEAILGSQKETAENLMIVDLIRHDLAGVKGIRDVRVPKLMTIEEYETVFQLVSVIEGDLDSSASGISVLAASLPPGSMTGAPKRRSCELLKSIEQHQPRGIYSGVLGYLDVGGGGDFSVVIRTAFRWNDENVWRIGAGGAVTILSTPEGEYEEMLVKRERLLDVLAGRELTAKLPCSKQDPI